MKRILLTIANVLLIVAMILVMLKGFSIGSLQILGFGGIKTQSALLNEKIGKVNQEINNYKSSLNTLQKDTSSLTSAKKDYLDLVAVSSASEIQEALQTKTYTIEYLWSKVGNYAAKEGVTVAMTLGTSTLGAENYKNLNFTVGGQYLAISQFIRDLENDSTLDFTIDSFDMTSSQATFTVKDVKIQQEKTSSGSNAGASSNNRNETTNANMNGSATGNQNSTSNGSTTNNQNSTSNVNTTGNQKSDVTSNRSAEGSNTTD